MRVLKLHESANCTCIRVSGEAAASFLQSQFSNDLRLRTAEPATYGLWLDRKGKVHADSFVLGTAEERFLLVSYYATAESIIEGLEANLVADEVELENVSHDWTVLSLWGAGVNDCLDIMRVEPPESGRFLRVHEGYLFCGRRVRPRSYDFLLDRATSAKIAGQCRALSEGNRVDLQQIDIERLHVDRLCSLIPAIPLEIGPGDLPQEGGLEEDAVSFTKGCYLGQEVMARIHSMGRSRRTLCRVSVDPALFGISGPVELFDGDIVAGKLRSVFVDGAQSIGCALFKNRFIEEGRTFRCGATGEGAVTISKCFFQKA